MKKYCFVSSENDNENLEEEEEEEDGKEENPDVAVGPFHLLGERQI